MRRPILWIGMLLIAIAACGDDKAKLGIETIPPERIDDLVLEKLPGRQVRLGWTAPGDDEDWGRAAVYDIRFSSSTLTEQTWDSASVVADPPVPAPAGERERFVVELPDGSWRLAIRAADEVPNWSGISNVVECEIEDKIPPAAVGNLIVSHYTTRSATLTWTAPGNDGDAGRAAAYDLRRSGDPITEENWDEAARIDGIPPPGEPGSLESLTVEELVENETYHFALKTGDDRENWSGISNDASVFTADVIPPNPVRDLSATSPSEDRIVLQWTAPGDDDTLGQAAVYDLRYALAPLSEDSWDGAIRIEGLPAPAPAGAAEEFEIVAPESGQMYYIGLKSADDASNWSYLSRVATAYPGANALMRLTYSSTRYGAEYPDWSPDGQLIVFSADWEPSSDARVRHLYTIPAGGGTVTRLTELPLGGIMPKWSPDGSQIAFRAWRDDFPHTVVDLAVMDALPGAAVRTLVAGGRTIMLSGPVWSPDGLRIAYYSWTFDYPNPLDSVMWAVPAGGGSPEVLVTGGNWNFGRMDWSPDGAQIVYGSEQSGNWEIWVKEIVGGIPVQLTQDPAVDAGPAWSPDGQSIAFSSNRSGSVDLWLMSATGESPVRLTSDPNGSESGPSWSPDGTAITFTATRDGKSDIWVLRLQ